ncbi:glycosyltransferase family 39 protein [Sandarakinorhabdus sp. DWP1-3-1]|uniref:glycosyltransferase family 39 protein n=1 Tax=Sandarakinorhabdus sp. DWP1-3-1 TaxID=2804627 RepID=UPI003CFA5F4D
MSIPRYFSVLALAGWLALMVLLQPINHDEDQYVAAAALAGQGLLPFRDFLYLQTPLQPYVLGPLAAITPGWTLLALRLANAAFGLATIIGVYGALRRHGAGDRTAAWAGGLLAFSVPFAYGARVARNDALPTALMALALWALAGSPGRTRLLLAGLALGLATSAKISLAPPLAAVGLWLAWQALSQRSRAGWAAVFAYGSGGVLGLLPSLAARAANPGVFDYGVLRFAVEAAPAWYLGNGLDARLTLAGKLFDSIVALAQGPALPALVLVAVVAMQRRRFGLLEALLLGAIIGALLPTPTWPQYFMPMLPPLFVLLGRDIDRMPRLARPALTSVAAVTGVVLLAIGGVAWQRAGVPAALAVNADARWMGAQIIGPGAIASLSVARVVDSGRRFDPRFAGGAAFYRTAGDRSTAELRRWRMTAPQTLAADLDRHPPAALLTGYEGASGVNRRRQPDARLAAWARSRGYRRVPTPDGVGTLWLPSRAAVVQYRAIAATGPAAAAG